MRNTLCSVMVILTFAPASLLAVDSGVAMARPYGSAWLNGIVLEQPSAIFPGDSVQTGAKSVLKIGSSGSNLVVLSDSLIKFEGGVVSVEHGGVKLVTSKLMSARAGSVVAAPASATSTEFEFSDAAGSVRIVALKGDLRISNGSETMILSQGQEAKQKDSDQVRNKRDQLSAKLLAGGTQVSAFAVAAAGTASAEAASRSADATTTTVLDGVHTNLTKPISPVR
jgi:hypothetical protein